MGPKVVDRLIADLKAESPTMKGMSPRSLRYMKAFAAAYPNQQFGGESTLQATPAKLTWYHHTTLLDKVKNLDERLFYMQATVENGRSGTWKRAWSIT